MATIDRGKAVFANLVDYPLPQARGVRDYVVYTVPSESPTPGYGWAARQFFRSFYKNHVEKEVSSLEGLIRALYTDVTQNNLQQIREIVLVTHANSQAMLFPILEGDNTFPYVNEN